MDGVGAGTELVRIEGAQVRREGRTILDIDELVFRRGEHVAILGPNGAGKSTLLGMMRLDILPVVRDDDRPAITLLGRPRWNLFDARKLIGVVSDDLQDMYDRGIRLEDAVVSGFFGSIGLYRHQSVTPEMRERAAEVMALLGVTELAHRRMDTLSTGEARRALIGRALVHEPLALVLDEPCDGLDPSAAYRFLEMLRRIAACGTTLVLVTHHVEDIVPEVTRVVMLKDGRVRHDGPKNELLTGERIGELFDVPATLQERAGWFRLWWE